MAGHGKATAAGHGGGALQKGKFVGGGGQFGGGMGGDNFLPPTSQMITRDDRQRNNNKKNVNLITQRISVFSKVNKVFSGLCHRYHNIEENIFE